MIHIKNFDSSLLKIGKTSYKNIEIYYIGYIKMKDLDYINNHGVNRLYYLWINQMDALKKAMEIDILSLVSDDKNNDTESWTWLKQ